jgi:hypothetical protein
MVKKQYIYDLGLCRSQKICARRASTLGIPGFQAQTN